MMQQLKSDEPSATAPIHKNGRTGARLFWRVFWLAFLVLSLAYAWYCFYTPSNSVSWSKGHAEAQVQSVKSGKPMILFFTGTWCVPCRIMKRTVWADPQVAVEVNERFISLMLYSDDPEMTDIFKRYSVFATPTIIITDPQGNALDWVQGKMEKEDFLTFIRKPYSTEKQSIER